MKLSEIVRYRNNLNEITTKDLEISINSKLSTAIHLIETGIIQIPHMVEQISQDQQKILESLKGFDNTLTMIKNEINQIIESMEHSYLANSYRFYQLMCHDTTEQILNRRFFLSDSVQDYLKSRIQMHSNWQHTAAVLRPGLESWIEFILGCDPLYVIDTDHDLFEPVKRRFNPEYLNRLRFYTIKESDTNAMLNQLPDGQFSFMLAYNFFHYKPFEIFRNYLIEIYKKLDLGGCLAFTFNDCDQHGAVVLAEKNFMCYTPGRMVRGLCESLGYQIVNYYKIDDAIVWMEIQKPGQHVSIKGGQTLAKFLEKSK